MSEHLLDFSLINWHSALVSIVKLSLLEKIVILGGISLILRDLGKLLQSILIACLSHRSNIGLLSRSDPFV